MFCCFFFNFKVIVWHEYFFQPQNDFFSYYKHYFSIITVFIALKMKFSIKDFSSKCDQVRSFLRIWSHLLKKSLMESFIFVQWFLQSSDWYFPDVSHLCNILGMHHIWTSTVTVMVETRNFKRKKNLSHLLSNYSCLSAMIEWSCFVK